MQAALAATATTADGSPLLALAYHNHVLLYNTATNTRISLTPPVTPSTASSSTAPPVDDDDENDDEPVADEDEADDDDSKAEQRLHKQPKAETPAAGAAATAHKPLSTHDILHAQNTLTAVRVLLFSPDANQLAIADDSKRLTLYDTATGAASCFHDLPKRVATACFIPRAHEPHTTRYELMVADKGGDVHRIVFAISAPSSSVSERAVDKQDSVTLSHLAIITSLSYSQGAAGLPALLFSSDSDGHIRLSRHPAHYDIHSFLLSAAGVISQVVVPGTQLCASGGVGDEVTVWRYGEPGASEVVQRVVVGGGVQSSDEPVQFIGQLVYDAHTSLLFVLSYPSSTVHTFSLSLTSPTPLTPLPASIAVESGQPSALSVDSTGRVYVVTDAAQLFAYVRADDGTWQLDSTAQRLSARVKDELTEVVLRDRREAEEEAGSPVAVAPVWTTGMTVYARWQEKLRRVREMNERQAQLAERRTNKKRKQ